jgi:hypothetical protein
MTNAATYLLALFVLSRQLQHASTKAAHTLLTNSARLTYLTFFEQAPNSF